LRIDDWIAFPANGVSIVQNRTKVIDRHRGRKACRVSIHPLSTGKDSVKVIRKEVMCWQKNYPEIEICNCRINPKQSSIGGGEKCVQNYF
jgi:hypothetical protein